MFSPFSVHYQPITKCRFGRPATDGNLLYETCVTKKSNMNRKKISLEAKEEYIIQKYLMWTKISIHPILKTIYRGKRGMSFLTLNVDLGGWLRWSVRVFMVGDAFNSLVTVTSSTSAT